MTPEPKIVTVDETVSVDPQWFEAELIPLEKMAGNATALRDALTAALDKGEG